jgi:hypothetical protein
MTPSDLEAIAAEPYAHRGIIHSEMALILHTCRRLGIEVVIESGRARGQSTYLLSKYLPEVAIFSVEMREDADAEYGRQRCASLTNVTLHRGNGTFEVPRLALLAEPRRTAILCDGPKGAGAVRIVKHCFDQCPHVLVGFIHDMRKLDHGGPSPHRAAAVAAFPDAKFSDHPGLVARSAWMDAKVIEAGGPCGSAHEREFGSYGPTVGVFLNSNSNKQRS